MPIIVAAYGYAITDKNAGVALLGALTVLPFLYLDANYLRQEKRYRRLYLAVGKGKPLTRFSLDPGEAPAPAQGRSEDWGPRTPKWLATCMPGPSVWLSWSILPFYVPILVAGLALAYFMARS